MAQAGGIFVGQRGRQLTDVQVWISPAAEVDAAGTVHVIPHSEKFTLRVEDLDAVILAVGDVDTIFRVGGDVMWDVELPRPDPGLAPREEQATVGGILVDTRVAVAIGDVD